MSPLSPAARLGLAFFAHFSIVGLTTPFWPLYLAFRGMQPEQVGLLLALAPWARFASNIGVGQLATRLYRPRALLLRLSVTLALVYALFPWFEGFTALLVLSLVVGILFAPLSPLIDTLALSAARRGEAHYGPVRVWGSLSFIIASSLGGQWLVAHSDAWILWGIVGACVVLAMTSQLAPAADREAPRPSGAIHRGSLHLLRRTDIRLLLLSSALLHGSHAMHYAFGSQTWRDAGIPDHLLGWLWAEGTLFEVVLFWMGERVSRRVSPPMLLVLGGLAGVVRWSLLSTTASLGAVIFGQALHSATFGCMHLGVMAYLRERVDVHELSAASTLYGGLVSGLSLALVFPVAGWCFDHFGLRAFALMAAMSAGGTLIALWLRARDRVRSHP